MLLHLFLFLWLRLLLITLINTLDGSPLGDNLITSHQVDYLFTALVSAETFEDNQEHFVVANKVGSITSLV